VKGERIYKITVFVFIITAIFVLFGGIILSSVTMNPANIPKVMRPVLIQQQAKLMDRCFLTALFFLLLANTFLLYAMLGKLSSKEQ